MKPNFRHLLTLAALLGGAVCLYPLSGRLDLGFRELPRPAEEVDGGLRIRGWALRTATLGYRELTADYLWLQVVQLVGDTDKSDEFPTDRLYALLQEITDLDSRFDMPYRAGGVMLAAYGKDVAKANEILEKGIRHRPDIWELPFYLGFNHFYYRQDYAAAARYIDQASRIEGRPPFLVNLAGRLYAQAKRPTTGIALLVTLLESTDDPGLRESYFGRIQELLIEEDLLRLEELCVRHEEQKGERPARLTDLVAAGLLPAIPLEPRGGYYYIERNGKPASSTLEERLRVNEKVNEIGKTP